MLVCWCGRLVWAVVVVGQCRLAESKSMTEEGWTESEECVGTFGDAVGGLLQQSSSLLLLHDGYLSSLILLHFLLTHHASSTPHQVANILTWRHDPWNYYHHHHNAVFGLTLLVFHNTSSLQSLHALEPGWIYGPMLLLALNAHHNCSDALWAVNSARFSSIIQITQALRGSHCSLSVTTLHPFNPPSQLFSVEVVGKGQVVYRQMVMRERYTSFHGHTLHLASWVDDFPIMYWSDNTNTTAIGVGITMMDALVSHLNFTYTVQPVTPDEEWAEYSNGSWSGLAGQLVRREKDLVINTFALMHDRVKVMDFSVPVATDSFSAVLRLPPLPPRWHAVFHPFTGLTWGALALTIIIITLFFHLLVLKDSSPVYNNKIDVVSTLVWMLRALLNQSVPRIPSSPGIRPFLVCWWLVSLVLASSYVTNIIAYITIPDTATKIKTLRQLAASDQKLYMCEYGSFLPGVMATSEDPVYRRLVQKLTLLLTYEDIRDKVIDERGVFIEGTAYIEYETSKWPVRDLYYVEEKIHPYILAWAFQRGTPWHPIFNRYLRHMTESGLVERWREEEISRYRMAQGRVATRGPPTGRSTLRPLSTEDLQSAFCILGVGVVISALTFVSEMITCP